MMYNDVIELKEWTMAKNSLAAFRIDPQTWENFKTFADNRGTSASALLTRFIGQCLESGSVPGTLEANGVDADVQKSLKRLESKIEAIESKINKSDNNDESQGEVKSEGLKNNLKGVKKLDKLTQKLVDKYSGRIPDDNIPNGTQGEERLQALRDAGFSLDNGIWIKA